MVQACHSIDCARLATRRRAHSRLQFNLHYIIVRVDFSILYLAVCRYGKAPNEHMCIVELGPVGDLAVSKVETLVPYVIKKGRKKDFTGLTVPRQFLVFQECCILILIFDLNIDYGPLSLVCESPLNLTISW